MTQPGRDWVLVDDVDDANPWRESLIGDEFARWADRRTGLAVLLDHDGSTRVGRGPVVIEGDRLRVLIGGVDMSVILDDLRLVSDHTLTRWFAPSTIVAQIEHEARAAGKGHGCTGDMLISIRLDPEQVVHGSVDLTVLPDRFRGRRLRAAVTTHGHVWALSRPLILARR